MKAILNFISSFFKKNTNEETKIVVPNKDLEPTQKPVPEDKTEIKNEVPLPKDIAQPVENKKVTQEVKVSPQVDKLKVAPKKELWYTKAKKWAKQMKTRGKYRKGYPEGAIIHFTAGRYGTQDMDSGIANGFAYLLIDDKGNVYQANSLDSWGYHAGVSSWKSLGSGVSEFLVGIEITAAGKVKKVGESYQTWFKDVLKKDQVREVKAKDNVQAGIYQKYTDEQEKALIDLLIWLKDNNPDVFSFDLVLGHDEVAPTRKNDPGGALSCTMPEFREKLKKLYKEKKDT